MIRAKNPALFTTFRRGTIERIGDAEQREGVICRCTAFRDGGNAHVGAAPHGGGAFSGKDTTKVDRSAAYAARYLAKNVVAAKIAEKCNIQLSYAIGVAQPLSVYVDTYGTGKVDDAEIETALRKVMDLSPTGIRKHLDLNKPIYAKTAAYGHFGRKPGRDGSFAWEKTNLVKPLKDALGVK